MKLISRLLVNVTMYTTPHYFISSLIAVVMIALHGVSNIREEEYDTLAEAVSTEITDSNLFTKIVILILWYGLYFAIARKIYILWII